MICLDDSIFFWFTEVFDDNPGPKDKKGTLMECWKGKYTIFILSFVNEQGEERLFSFLVATSSKL